MIPLESMVTNAPDCLYTIEFYTLHAGRLVRKKDAEREWMESEGLKPEPLDRTGAEECLLRLLATFQREGRVPRWVQFHPEIPPALVGNIASGRQVVIQLRECIEPRPTPRKGAFTRRASTPPPVFS